VLKYLGAILKQPNRKRKGDTICGYGGEEFAVLVPGANSEQVYRIAEQLRTAIESDVANRPPALTGRVTVSIGVARTDQTRDPKELMGFPDQALYQAKGCRPQPNVHRRSPGNAGRFRAQEV
jgi:diguanylate cyclase (GGDEF)-like protein